MKNLFLFTFLVSLIFSQNSLGQEMAQKVCSPNIQVCASYLTNSPFSTKGEGRFILSLKTNNEVPLELLKVDLWMQMGNHGHGSAPLKVNQLAPGEFDVTNAYFVMKGKWLIRVTVKIGLITDTILIPVVIAD